MTNKYSEYKSLEHTIRHLYEEDPFKIDDGKITISNRPGWGISIKQEWLENSIYQVSEL
mgnify:CR=1 FL=1